MANHIMKSTVKQPSLFDLLPSLPVQVADKWQFSLQRYETDKGMFYAIQDWIAGLAASDTVKASELWRQMKDETRISVTSLDYQASDGKNYQRPFTDDKGLYRIAQNLRSTKQRPALDAIKKFLADSGAYVDEMRRSSTDSVQLSKQDIKRNKEIEKYERAGLGDRPEIIHLKSEAESKLTVKMLKNMVDAIVDNPKWYEVFTLEYIQLFGMSGKQICDVYVWKDVRSNLPTLQLDTITFAEKRLMTILQMQKQGRISHQQLKDSIILIMKPIGRDLKALCEMLGIDHVSGKPLLSASNP